MASRMRRSENFLAPPPCLGQPLPIKPEAVPTSPCHSSESDSSCSVMAPPPTARRAKVTNKNHSIFLESTYQMIERSHCDTSHVASWSDMGDTFIIKDPTEFANKIIPVYFRHSKFTSFVRQLNFYGFRKLKVDDPHLLQEEKGWWEFQHDKFLRGHKELLKDIRRRTCTGIDGINQVSRDMTTLQTEVKSLKEDMFVIKEKLNYFTQIITELTKSKEAETKKRKPECVGERPIFDASPSKRPNIAASQASVASLFDFEVMTPMSSLFHTNDLDAAFPTDELSTPRGFFHAIESH